MTLIYEHLESNYDYEFTIVHSTTEDYEHSSLRTDSIPTKAWKSTIPHTPIFLRKSQYRKHLDPRIKSADAILTVDPTIFYQGALIIERAHYHNTPVWYDASKTIVDPDPHWYAIRPRIEEAVDQTNGIIATVPKVMERYRDLDLYSSEIAEKFTIMGHPVDTEQFAPVGSDNMSSVTESESVGVLAMTRLVPEKGVYYLLEAMTPLLDSDDAELRFLGEGSMRPLIEREARQRGIRSNIEFLGTVPHKQVPAILHDADIFVNHAVTIDSWEEYFGAANLEAMACGLPTVVTDCGAIPYVIRDQDVVEMVSQRDVAQLRKTIEQLVDDPSRRRELAAAGRKYVKSNYAVAKLANRYHEMLQRGITE
jgi:glycosyltransferase involved in cell wall biosynthesis